MIRILTSPLAAMAALLLSVFGAFAEPRTIYVSENGDDDQADVGTEWAKAYRNIQPAVDAAVEGDTVLVGDGYDAVYLYMLGAECSLNERDINRYNTDIEEYMRLLREYQAFCERRAAVRKNAFYV